LDIFLNGGPCVISSEDTSGRIISAFFLSTAVWKTIAAERQRIKHYSLAYIGADIWNANSHT
jgi:hypothetical protein